MKQFQFLFLAISLVYFSACGDTDPSEFTGTADDVFSDVARGQPSARVYGVQYRV